MNFCIMDIAGDLKSSRPQCSHGKIQPVWPPQMLRVRASIVDKWTNKTHLCSPEGLDSMARILSFREVENIYFGVGSGAHGGGYSDR